MAVLAVGIVILCSTAISYAGVLSSSPEGEDSFPRCIMFNYLKDGHTVYFCDYTAGKDEFTAGGEYISYSKGKVEIPPEPDTGDEATIIPYYKIVLDNSIKSGNYQVSFTEDGKAYTIIFTDKFDTTSDYDFRIKDLDGYFTTTKTAVDQKDRIALPGDVRFNYVEEGTRTIYLRLRKGTGMVMGNEIDVVSDGTVSAKTINDKTMAITLSKDAADGVHKASISFDRANPFQGRVYRSSFDVEFTDREASGSLENCFFIPDASSAYEILLAGSGETYRSVETGDKYWVNTIDAGSVIVNTSRSHTVAYVPEMNYDYKTEMQRELSSSNPLVSVSSDVINDQADDWTASYAVKKPYIKATLAKDAPAGTHTATIHATFFKSNGQYDIFYTVTFVKDAPPVDELFTDVPSDAWYKAYLQTAYSNKIIGGMTASSYGPSSKLTHGQIIVMVANLHNLQNGGAYDFQSHSVSGGHWCSAYLEYCKAEGMLDDRFDGCLNDTVDRGEMAYYFAHAISEDSYRQKKTVDLIDIEGVPYAEDIEKLASANIVGGYSDKTFRADNPVTRAETAVFISNIIDAINE